MQDETNNSQLYQLLDLLRNNIIFLENKIENSKTNINIDDKLAEINEKISLLQTSQEAINIKNNWFKIIDIKTVGIEPGELIQFLVNLKKFKQNINNVMVSWEMDSNGIKNLPSLTMQPKTNVSNTFPINYITFSNDSSTIYTDNEIPTTKKVLEMMETIPSDSLWENNNLGNCIKPKNNKIVNIDSNLNVLGKSNFNEIIIGNSDIINGIIKSNDSGQIAQDSTIYTSKAIETIINNKLGETLWEIINNNLKPKNDINVNISDLTTTNISTNNLILNNSTINNIIKSTETSNENDNSIYTSLSTKSLIDMSNLWKTSNNILSPKNDSNTLNVNNIKCKSLNIGDNNINEIINDTTTMPSETSVYTSSIIKQIIDDIVDDNNLWEIINNTITPKNQKDVNIQNIFLNNANIDNLIIGSKVINQIFDSTYVQPIYSDESLLTSKSTKVLIDNSNLWEIANNNLEPKNDINVNISNLISSTISTTNISINGINIDSIINNINTIPSETSIYNSIIVKQLIDDTLTNILWVKNINNDIIPKDTDAQVRIPILISPSISTDKIVLKGNNLENIFTSTSTEIPNDNSTYTSLKTQNLIDSLSNNILWNESQTNGEITPRNQQNVNIRNLFSTNSSIDNLSLLGVAERVNINMIHTSDDANNANDESIYTTKAVSTLIDKSKQWNLDVKILSPKQGDTIDISNIISSTSFVLAGSKVTSIFRSTSLENTLTDDMLLTGLKTLKLIETSNLWRLTMDNGEISPKSTETNTLKIDQIITNGITINKILLNTILTDTSLSNDNSVYTSLATTNLINSSLQFTVSSDVLLCKYPQITVDKLKINEQLILNISIKTFTSSTDTSIPSDTDIWTSLKTKNEIDNSVTSEALWVKNTFNQLVPKDDLSVEISNLSAPIIYTNGIQIQSIRLNNIVISTNTTFVSDNNSVYTSLATKNLIDISNIFIPDGDFVSLKESLSDKILSIKNVMIQSDGYIEFSTAKITSIITSRAISHTYSDNSLMTSSAIIAKISDNSFWEVSNTYLTPNIFIIVSIPELKANGISINENRINNFLNSKDTVLPTDSTVYTSLAVKTLIDSAIAANEVLWKKDTSNQLVPKDVNLSVKINSLNSPLIITNRITIDNIVFETLVPSTSTAFVPNNTSVYTTSATKQLVDSKNLWATNSAGWIVPNSSTTTSTSVQANNFLVTTTLWIKDKSIENILTNHTQITTSTTNILTASATKNLVDSSNLWEVSENAGSSYKIKPKRNSSNVSPSIDFYGDLRMNGHFMYVSDVIWNNGGYITRVYDSSQINLTPDNETLYTTEAIDMLINSISFWGKLNDGNITPKNAANIYTYGIKIGISETSKVIEKVWNSVETPSFTDTSLLTSAAVKRLIDLPRNESLGFICTYDTTIYNINYFRFGFPVFLSGKNYIKNNLGNYEEFNSAGQMQDVDNPIIPGIVPLDAVERVKAELFVGIINKVKDNEVYVQRRGDFVMWVSSNVDLQIGKPIDFMGRIPPDNTPMTTSNYNGIIGTITGKFDNVYIVIHSQ